MHEFGHALGLGHASSSETINGLELMFPTLSMNKIIYPSTLDIYGLSILYKGGFSRTVQLPTNIPYQMLEEAPELPYLSQPLFFLYPSVDIFRYFLTYQFGILSQPMVLLIPSVTWMIIATTLGLAFRSRKSAIIISISFSYLTIYYFSTIYNDFDAISIGLKIITLLPTIAIGAYIGESISSSFKKREQTEDNAMKSTNISQSSY
jgi:hypothetical protein